MPCPRLVPVPAVKLSPESALLSDQTRSLLYPVRKYKGDLASTARWVLNGLLYEKVERKR